VNTHRRRIAQCASLLIKCERVNGHLERVLRCLHGTGLLGRGGGCVYPSGLFIGEDSLSEDLHGVYCRLRLPGGPSGNEDEKCRRT
jgi:hypothetical protein